MNVDPVRTRYLIGGVFLLALGLYNFATYTVALSQQSTFNILSGQYEYVATTRNPGDSVSGSFREISGTPLNFYIESSAQYASFQTGTFTGSLYSIQDAPSGSISYTFTVQDTFYLLFRHGTGLLNTTQTINFQRTYTTHDSFRLGLGILFVALAAVDFAFGFRRRKSQASMVPLPMPPSGLGEARSPTIPGTGSAPLVCSNCGRVVMEQASFCPNCGSRLSSGNP